MRTFLSRHITHLLSCTTLWLVLLMVFAATSVQAQIFIGGNVYGGGNAGNTGGSTSVTVYGGDIKEVYGGARMAHVGDSAFVTVDARHATADILIARVYGGNDISGTIASSALVRTIPCSVKQTASIGGQTVSADSMMMVIGTLYGAGNGDYVYKDSVGNDLTDGHGNYIVRDAAGDTVATSMSPFSKPELSKTCLELKGGCIAHVYGGGNAATVTSGTTINIDNSSDDLERAVTVWAAVNYPDSSFNDVFQYLLSKVDISVTQSDLSSKAYHFARVFGGNNKADMAIRPKWNLQRGIIRDLYGGGNEGRMTSPEGLLLQIEGDGMTVQNVYGGCRKSDVHALYSDGTPVPYDNIQLDPNDNPNKIPGGYAARVRVLGGHVTNVYGGNDISGNIYGGSTVGILARIYGNVYGGGNGSYAYTDNPALKDDPDWRDFYYNPKEILGLSGDTFTGLQSAEALNVFRPNAERVSILVRGTQEKPTIVEGALYVGGNSASLRSQTSGGSSGSNMTHVKIGSYVTIDNVFLGNNGENMIKTDEANPSTGKNEGVLRTLARTDIASDGSKFNSMQLTDSAVFAKYMEGCAMKVNPTIVFDDSQDYVPYSTQFGSIFCGGNVGSIIVPGKITVDFNDKVIVYDKVVGGCNNANVYATDYNAEYLGGMLGAATPAPEGAIGDKLELNFGGLKIQPKRWNHDKTELVWNTISASTGEEVNPVGLQAGESTDADLDRRLKGGNIYGGCYNTGHVNGNVIINLNASVVDRKGEYAIFDQIEQNEGEAILYGNDSYNITERRSGVILDCQGMDVLGKALNVFGGGYGGDSEIWGGTTINLNAGYTFQIFGGGEKGPVGKAVSHAPNPNDPTIHDLTYEYDDRYSCHVNLKGAQPGVYRGHTDDSDDMAEAEFIYGGSFEAPIAGNTVINLGNGRIFNSFAGSCNADILGHTETYIGRQANSDGTYTDGGGFPWIRDHVYGGNDMGGQILGSKNFIDRVKSDVQAKIHNPKAAAQPEVTEASAYMEYIQGRVDYIFGGCYGDYDYTEAHYRAYTYANGTNKQGFTKPRMDNAFVHFVPTTHARNEVTRIYGAGQGHSHGIGVDSMQNRSYVLVDIPSSVMKFQHMAVFGAGANCGLGMAVSPLMLVNHKNSNNEDVEGEPDRASAVIDLMRGYVKNAYGGSFAEGTTRRTVVNVPRGATIQMDSIFGGAYGADPLYPCDVYEAQVNYRSEAARVSAIFGGNNSADRTLYGQVNVDVPVWQKNGYMGTVFGAGFGRDTWSQYTEVNLLDGAHVWEVYGGGNNGKVLNTQSLVKWRHDEGASLDLSLPGYEDTSITYKDKDNTDFHLDAGFNSPLAHAVRLDGLKYNTNVHIYKGATVERYAYGGGLGADAVVSGTTYIDLLGGTVGADLYAGGTSGAVQDHYQAKTFTATATAYIEGGTVRNVYGGGWEGHIGYHDTSTTNTANDISGKTNVVIGIRKDQASLPEGYGYYKGVPAILRNAYSGGEGGSVFGTANLTLNNGYIGYTYNSATDTYEEKLHDETWTDHIGKDRLSDCGNLFGGGYDDNSSVDSTCVTVWGGVVRNSVFGGGEIATIGRGKVKESDVDNKVRELESISKYGRTQIHIYNGHVKRNVFGGGKGYNILGYGGIHGFYTDGYVFGQTEVYIHGGEIGTEAGVADGDGNVFGGGDVGFVYGPGYFTPTSGQTSTGSPNHYYYYDAQGHLTEDCKVVIEPMLQVKPSKSVSYQGRTYGPYEYVPTEYLNTLSADKTDEEWRALFTGDKKADGSVYEDDPVERGIQIRNAVFAGGNVSSNSESYNNATTVYGNTTATLHDVFHRDFITVGTEHTGGLYGGGNLSLVGGYRELNITNYGTDYYGMDEQISLEKYQTLTNRERAYFKLEYQFQQVGPLEINGKEYKKNDRVSEDDYNKFPEEYKNETYWKQYGFCSIYAGRLLNTIQRADFCGVFGSRLVLQGAKDRVADVADATEYTINRVGELSLNQERFIPNDDSEIHGNYFGIYSVVNYLGNLTSDIHFTDTRRYMLNGQAQDDPNGLSYYNYKVQNLSKRDRNNGTSLNQVALASGVFLELTSEKSTPSNKIYGDITGIVELDLINVKKDIEGGGYVYARNEHGLRSTVANTNVLLSPYNKKEGNEALTRQIYTYSSTELYPYQTSGNFIHKSKRIVDDCYPNNGIYTDNKGNYVTSPAHYWFIKGEVYIYDQKVSAYAGSATAYSKEVKLPLTITAGSNGKLQLLNIQPSLYAYYADGNRNETKKITADGIAVDNESMTYHLNDVITWWDWHQLSQNEQKYFVKETYVNVDACTIDGTAYEAGAYVLENDRTLHATTAWDTFQASTHTVLNAAGSEVTDLSSLFHPSNNISHNTGYVLTLDMNSPKDWNDWFTPVNSNSGLPKIRREAYEALSDADKEKYREGPTYTLKPTEGSGLYGQREYAVGEIISEETYKDYTTTVAEMSPAPTGQATVKPAYVALADMGTVQAGSAISETEYLALADKSNYAPAMVCVNSIQLGEEEYVLMGELVSGTDADLDTLANRYMRYNNAKINADEINHAGALKYITDNLSKAYYITEPGLYGGQYFQSGINYAALKSWSELTESRDKFDFNYDALDVLVDPQYHGEGYINTYYHAPYSEVKSVEYTAAYTGGVNGTSTLTYTDGNNVSHTLHKGDIILREDYENCIPNEQLHYTRIQVEKGSDTQTVYIATQNIINNGTPYAKGQDISEKDYNALTDENKALVATKTFQKNPNETQILHYCFEDYTPSATFTTVSGTAGAAGSAITDNVFTHDVPNSQKDFTIQGAEPTETTTLYVSRESNAKDVTSEKVISVVYQYTYYEADDEGEGVSLVNELHVLNIHLQLESGAPEIGPLTAPPAVLPGNTVGLKAPSVNPGLYEVLTSGWELFNDENDAMLHRNGVAFTNNGTPLYWYQNQKVWLAFYSKTYLGKTYSNYVPLTVANYHDLDAVMKDKEHHLYVDHPDVMRNSKIYIDNRDCESDPDKSELDLLKDFFDLSMQTAVATTGATAGHALLNNRVKGGAKLEFILNSDVAPKAYTNWTSIGSDDTYCFMGNLHGDGYTISGLDRSLFGKLCGNVYNLGVTGSFTSAGVADEGGGYMENCWIHTTGEPDGSVKAVFGNPSDPDFPDAQQVVNCYYPDTKAYAEGAAIKKSEQAFYNGEVAYDLNGFYLYKRYSDKKVTSGVEYKYLVYNDGELSDLQTGHYGSHPANCSSGYNGLKYVESRYVDGDFRYAGGTIPESVENRMRTVETAENTIVPTFAPIWPDDYLFFGQNLNYGWGGTHQEEPGHFTGTNRVYRAPAYYGGKTMGVFHYNANAYIVANSKPTSLTDTNLKDTYPGMTAVDFAGHNDALTGVNSYVLGMQSSKFYAPLLDDDGLTAVTTSGETQNLLVYAPSAETNEATYNVLSSYFTEPVFDDYYDESDSYQRVGKAIASGIHGHLVMVDRTAVSDHLLVDKQAFNAPIGYTFTNSKRMWYQRMPDRYVDVKKGWETVSLPFTAVMVTTNDKGELTHFYEGSTVGHEYWLRELNGIAASTTEENTFVATMNKLGVGSASKDYTNTFLWDYYYKKNSYRDENEDEYQKRYYSDMHTYNNYPYSTVGSPYLIGFPGSRYYEFDLSGTFEPQHTYANISKLNAQTVTFASEKGISIDVSEDELSAKVVTRNGYTFVPNYMSKEVENGYMLNSDGDSFVKADTAQAIPFRPYFVAGSGGSAKQRNMVKQIVFNEDVTSFAFEENDPTQEDVGGELRFYTKKHLIGVESSLSKETDVTIVNTSGLTMASFTIQPGETIETHVPMTGVYIIRAASGKYNKKITVK